MSDSTISKLFVSSSQTINDQELYDLLLPYVSIDKDSHEIIFSQAFQELTNANKILIILSAMKAKSLHLKIDEKISPSEIIKISGIKPGSVKATLKALLDAKEIKSEKSRYSVPNYKISQLAAIFKNYNQKK